MISLEASRSFSDEALHSFLAEKTAAAKKIHPSYAKFFKEITRVAEAGGKRLRPHLVFLGYGAYTQQIARVAAAYEFIHLAFLVFDDIIDRDDMRRGQPTIHKEYIDTHYRTVKNEADKRHFATSAAVLAGGTLISSAYELIGEAELSKKDYEIATKLLATGVFEVAGGELLDTEASFLHGSYDPLVVYRYKTASYSVIAPLLTGASLSPAKYSQKTLGQLRDFATNLGIAYQIQDDILGVFGDESITGKSATGDLREGKQTLLIDLFKKAANSEQLQFFEQSFGNSAATDAQLLKLKELLKSSGALAAAQAEETRYKGQALAAIADLSDATLRDNLLALARSLTDRKA